MDTIEITVNIGLSKTAERRMKMTRTVPSVQYTPVRMDAEGTFTALTPLTVPYGFSKAEKDKYCKVHNVFIAKERPVNVVFEIDCDKFLEGAKIVSVEEREEAIPNEN